MAMTMTRTNIRRYGKAIRHSKEEVTVSSFLQYSVNEKFI